jgi:hypothetical protein
MKSEISSMDVLTKRETCRHASCNDDAIFDVTVRCFTKNHEIHFYTHGFMCAKHAMEAVEETREPKKEAEDVQF